MNIKTTPKMLKNASFWITSILVLQIPSHIVVRAQDSSLYETREERDLYDTKVEGFGTGSILDSANPMELINKMRRISAMENATPPSDAIDKALDSYSNIP